LKNTSAVTLFFSLMLHCETNQLLSALGKQFKKFVHAFFFAASAFFNAGPFHKLAILFEHNFVCQI